MKVSPAQVSLQGRVFLRAGIIAFLCLMFLPAFQAASAQAQTKSLKLYYLHTGEKSEIVFKRNGRYDQAGLKKLNWFLRDWRRNEPTKMNPLLFDLIWEAYRQSGSRKYIHVISGYRSPKTNEMLRRTRGGQAKKSQHMVGNALDFFLPDVKLAKMREIGLKLQVGGVGYYPKSGSPFVHLDVGRVRHWPRMSRSQLARVFPDGKSLHIPTDGKPLSGYKAAVASYEKRKKSGNLVPNAGGTKGASSLFAMLKGKGTKDTADEEEAVEVAANNTPAPRSVDVIKLPRRVPVPETAPRVEQLDNGQEMVVASLPPQQEVATPETAPVEPVAEAVEETPAEPELPVEAGTEPESPLGQLASIPVPARRPEYELPAAEEADTLVAEAEEVPAPVEDTEITTRDQPVETAALENPLPGGETNTAAFAEEPDVTGTQLAALTPREIEDLRRNAMPRENTGSRSPETQTPEPQALEPRTLPEPETAAVRPIPPEVVPVPEATTQNTDTQETGAAMEVAAIEPVNPVPLMPVETPLPVPVPNPAEPPMAEVIPPEPIEPGVASTGEIAIPEANPQFVETATPEPVTPELQAPVLAENEQPANANIPVPDPNPRLLALLEPVEEPVQEPALLPVTEPEPEVAPVELASTEEPEETDVEMLADANDLGSRTISLDPLSAPEENSSVVGRWALAQQPTINHRAPVQAPAYGRNMIRQIPDKVPVTGFAMANAANPYSGFSGHAVRFTKFASVIR